mmetsp:Transcript_28810/g.35391  ORF Transcript_28810/g.35391 Transcript_28810/m.35391 type:complete len:96 (-) Transcript_28810:418-705(-)
MVAVSPDIDGVAEVETDDEEFRLNLALVSELLDADAVAKTIPLSLPFFRNCFSIVLTSVKLLRQRTRVGVRRQTFLPGGCAKFGLEFEFELRPEE